MHVEQQPRLAAHGVQGHRAGTVVSHRYREAGQLIAQIFKDAAGVDCTRRVARVASDQRAQVRQRGVKQGVHREVSPRKARPAAARKITVLMRRCPD